MFNRLLRTFGYRRDARSETDALLSAAATLLNERDFRAAIDKAQQALDEDPRSPKGLHIFGVAQCHAGDFPRGLEALRSASRLDAGNAGLHLDYANALRAAGHVDDAEVAYRRAIALNAGFGAAHRALGNLLIANKERQAEAGEEFERALALDPDDREAARGAALAAYLAFDYRKSRDIYARLYEMGLLEPTERHYFGCSLQQTGELDAAVDVLRETVALAPDGSPVKHMTERALALCLLLAGRWDEGLAWHERRFAAMRLNPEGDVNRRWLGFLDTALGDVPPWQDGSCTGKRILVWVEQGLGDAIMLMRLLPVLLEDCHAASVSLLCSPPLESFQTCFAGIRFFVASPTWKAQPGEYDLHCSIMSLPYLLKLAPDRMPGRVPYIFVQDPGRWPEKLAKLPGIKVGLAWAGNPIQTFDSLRSLALDQLAPLFAVKGLSFVSLQKDDAARDELRQREAPIADLMGDCGDLMDTAALIDNLDLVISVDTAMAHLAGAMGKPVWLLNRFESEWRWMRDREDSVWYPSMRIFSQPQPRQWAPVIDRIANEVRAVVGDAGSIA